jgi:hypothetical protein
MSRSLPEYKRENSIPGKETHTGRPRAMTRFGGEVDPEPWPGCNSINTTLDKTKVLTHRNSRNLGKNEGQIRAVPLAPNTN